MNNYYSPPYAAIANAGQSKTTRENLHNTTMAVDSIEALLNLGSPVVNFSFKQKIVSSFADTICEASESLTPEEVYQALVEAIEGHYQYTTKEFNHATQLRDLITGFKNA